MSTAWGMIALENACANPDARVPEEGRQILAEAKKKKKKKNKYGAVSVRTEEGLFFPSGAEYKHYGLLRWRELAGEISDLELQPKLILHSGVIYRADFRFKEVTSGQIVIHEVKGGKATQTQSFKDKWKQAKDIYPEYKFEVIGGDTPKRGRR